MYYSIRCDFFYPFSRHLNTACIAQGQEPSHPDFPSFSRAAVNRREGGRGGRDADRRPGGSGDSRVAAAWRIAHGVHAGKKDVATTAPHNRG